MPIALPDFLTGGPAEGDIGRNVTAVITNNLQRSGLFVPINPAAFIEKISNSDSVPRFPDWRTINAQALVTGRITRQAVVRYGDREVRVGGGAPMMVQSMTNTDTADAVRAFQSTVKVAPTGTVDAYTAALLASKAASPTTAPASAGALVM